MDNLAVIININAGNLEPLVNHGGFLDKVREYTKDYYITNSPEQLEKAVEEIWQKRIKRIAVFGGDGSYHCSGSEIVKRYQKELPQLIFLGGGTQNYVQKSLYQERGPFEILEKIKNNNFEIKRKYLLKVNDLYGFYFGTGVLARFNALYKKEFKKSKRQPLFWSVLKAIPKYNEIYKVEEEMDRYKVSIEGREFKEEGYIGIFAGVLKKVAGVKPFYLAEEGKGFHLKLSQMLKLEMIVSLRKLRGGKPLPRTEELLVKKATIIPLTKKDYVIDGDPYHALQIDLELGPEIEVLV